jgi:hypothetical protein
VPESVDNLLVDIQRLGIELEESHKDRTRLEEEKAELQRNLEESHKENDRLRAAASLEGQYGTV